MLVACRRTPGSPHRGDAQPSSTTCTRRRPPWAMRSDSAPGVDGVLQELLGHRDGALDDLRRRRSCRRLGRQETNRHARYPSRGGTERPQVHSTRPGPHNRRWRFGGRAPRRRMARMTSILEPSPRRPRRHRAPGAWPPWRSACWPSRRPRCSSAWRGAGSGRRRLAPGARLAGAHPLRAAALRREAGRLDRRSGPCWPSRPWPSRRTRHWITSCLHGGGVLGHPGDHHADRVALLSRLLWREPIGRGRRWPLRWPWSALVVITAIWPSPASPPRRSPGRGGGPGDDGPPPHRPGDPPAPLDLAYVWPTYGLAERALS